MKIGTFVRTRNEKWNIERFIETHIKFSNRIYIADSGSTDETVWLAERYPMVSIRNFDERVYNADGTWYAHESRHYQFLFDWAQEEGVDWAIFDDADHAPNIALQQDARLYLEMADAPFAYSLLMYVWGYDQYFPRLNDCNPSERLWAWRPKEWMPTLNLNADKTIEITNQPDARINEALVFPHPPYCVLHYGWQNTVDVRRKIEFNARRGVPMAYPLDSCGELQPIPDWVDANWIGRK